MQRCLVAVALSAAGLVPAIAEEAARRPHWAAAPNPAPIVHEVGHAELLVLTLPATPHSTFDRFYVHGLDGIQACQPGRPAPLWPRPFPTQRKPMLLLVDSTRAVFATGYELFALEAHSGRRLWRWGADPVALKAVGADPEDFPRQRYFATDGAQIVALRDDGHAVGVDVLTGKTLWSHVLAQVPTGSPVLAGQDLVYPAVVEQTPAACLCAAGTGRLVRVLPAPAGQAVQRVLLAAGPRVVLVSAGAISTFSTAGGADAWTHATADRLTADRITASATAVYVTADGYGLHKLALTDGAPVWSAPGTRVGRAAQATLALFGEHVVVATGDEATLFAAGDGRRLAHATLALGQEIDRWEIADGRLIGLRRAAPGALETLTLDPAATATFSAPAANRYIVPGERIDTVALCDDSLVVCGGGIVVSFASTPPAAAPAAAIP